MNILELETENIDCPDCNCKGCENCDLMGIRKRNDNEIDEEIESTRASHYSAGCGDRRN